MQRLHGGPHLRLPSAAAAPRVLKLQQTLRSSGSDELVVVCVVDGPSLGRELDRLGHSEVFFQFEAAIAVWNVGDKDSGPVEGAPFALGKIVRLVVVAGDETEGMLVLVRFY